MNARAEELVSRLALAPHPEGGHYRELFRSPRTVQPADDRPPRSALTTILYLLPAGAHSRWHRVASDEVWHLLEGGPLELLLAPPALDRVERIRAGAALAAEGPVQVAPAGWWQAARSLGDYALCGCTVGPGFDFADFTMLRDDPAAAAALARLSPALAALA